MSKKYRGLPTAFTKEGVCVYVIEDDKTKGVARVRNVRGGNEYTANTTGMIYTKDMESVDLTIKEIGI